MPEPTLQDLQNVIAMIARDLDTFCRENDITYYMMGGTALGAMRHGGFIPWDDDFDVFMDLENYRKFLKLAADWPTDKYYLQKEDTAEWPLFFSKLRLNGSFYQESDNVGRDMHHGIYVDIMCLNSAYSNTILRKIQYTAARAVSTYGLARRGYKTTSRTKQAALAVSKLIGLPPVKALLMKIARGGENSSSDMVGHFFGRAPFAATSFPRAYLGTPRYVPFEDQSLPVPANVDAYLTTRFGPRYMDPPSDAVRAAFPSHVEAFDLGDWGP